MIFMISEISININLFSDTMIYNYKKPNNISFWNQKIYIFIYLLKKKRKEIYNVNIINDKTKQIMKISNKRKYISHNIFHYLDCVN